MGLFDKIKSIFCPPEVHYLSVKGYYYLKYCKKIIDGVLDESALVQDYEETLESFRKDLRKKDDSPVTREDAAEVFVELMFYEMNVVPCDELIEMGIESLDDLL